MQCNMQMLLPADMRSLTVTALHTRLGGGSRIPRTRQKGFETPENCCIVSKKSADVVDKCQCTCVATHVLRQLTKL
jgi:hypothetical protein